MAEGSSVPKEVLVQLLSELVKEGREVLEKVVEESKQGSMKEFVLHRISSLGTMIGVYATFLNRLSVQKRCDAEQLWKKYFYCSDVRDCVDDLLQFEIEWNSFLQSVDSVLQCDNITAQLELGGQVSQDLEFVEARSGRSIKFADYLGKGKKLLLVLLRHFA
ncbi:selenoprotein L [Latimeria chalumnae]|uniref:selenoprotein L n=1 Tax=Latimeria chalumnae TaxID=7897 RepID=UPI0006D9009D|nr:PREDICTED: uncharacterized protein LOC106706745 [Latimeria chalumnae]|eukprot:XP_014353576.1 PREDICTED: uncharacterized protein LOC106706745 [Latimeria chalumnae]